MSKVRRKRDQAAFVQHIDRLAAAPPGDAQGWWPRFLFHFTDILNAVSILNRGEILSRDAAISAGVMKNDNASASVIQLHKDYTWQYARFYFGPRTPTQYNNEGFRPIGQRSIDSHCPVPVYFLLDSKEVLTMEQVMFTDGNLAKGAELMGSGQDFVNLPFDLIFHRRPVTPLNRDEVVYHRHAEVVVPDRLPITPSLVKFILCRSPAEMTTLLHLLDENARAKWGHLIGTRPKAQLFNGYWTYVESAVLGDNEATITFNPNTRTPGPFELKVVVTDELSGEDYILEETDFHAAEPLRLDLDVLSAPSYTLKLYLDDHIAFADTYAGWDIPF